MKLKHIAVACLSTLALSACQTTKIEDLKPTADQKTIDKAKERLSEYEWLDVSDNGVISYTSDLGSTGGRWKTSRVKEKGYRLACEDLRWFVESGMIVRVYYRGSGGYLADYDKERCETEIPSDIYE
ncbi:hypothetical protein [Vibrio coralliilyticus]|uniref:hypothetical protein n=1 Tax=Vibrio coralliilyticus TaxID=190893 RepID=UPI002FCE781E